MPRISAVILAAGEARRMGGSKANLHLGGIPFLDHLVGRLEKVAHQISIVHGAHPIVRRPQTMAILHLISATKWRCGMRSSLSAGLLQSRGDRIILTHIDRPFVTVKTLRRLLDTPTSRSVVPVYRGQLGHPVILPPDRARQLAGNDDRPLNWFLPDNRTQCITVDDPGVILNINDPRDYARSRFLFRKSSLSACIHGQDA